jgi:N-acetylmuramoyl-L-alanine amidase
MRSKKTIILVVIIVLVVSILGIAGFMLLNKKNNVEVEFVFFDDVVKEIEVNSTAYILPEASVVVNGEDMGKLLEIDKSNFDLTKVGTYILKYYIIYNNKRYEEEKEVSIVDKTSPVITLNGDKVTILVGEEYEEPGYEVTDNSMEELEVTVSGEVDTSKAGVYTLTYKTSDSSGNEAEVTREVTVKKPNVVVAVVKEEPKVSIPKVVETSYENTIKVNKFTGDNVYLEGYVKEPLEENKIVLVGDSTYEFPITVSDNKYTINLSFGDVANGDYKMFVNEEALLNKMNIIERLARGKVGSKLVSFSYNGSDEVSINVSNHGYTYDVLINPGHGGSDSGAVNAYIQEKEMNLTVSLYEKCRYEAHGLSVYMTREGDYYGDDFGPSSLSRLHRTAYEVGHYGVVSRVVYSNHHNSIGNNYFSGYEVLIGGQIKDLANELAIVNKWNSIYNLTESHKRFYAKDYDTEIAYSKLNGEMYTFKDNYAMNRIPYQIFNVKSIIYEGSYMSNKNEFIWYWNEGNWRKASEAKIEVYVNYLGKTYNPDNSSCL